MCKLHERKDEFWVQNLNVLIKLCQTCSHISTLILHRIAKMKYYVYQTTA